MPPPTQTFIFVDAELGINKKALSVFFSMVRKSQRQGAEVNAKYGVLGLIV